MTRVKESAVKKKVRSILDKFECFYFMPSMGTYGAAGVPDFVVCISGFFLSIETKGTGGTVTELQKLQMSNIRKNFGVTLLVDDKNIDTLERTLKEVRLGVPREMLDTTIYYTQEPNW